MLYDITGALEYATADPAMPPSELLALRNAVQIKAYDLADVPCSSYDQSDCRVLKIGLKTARPNFHTITSLWITYPAKQELIDSGGDSWWETPGNQIGNGPFALTNLDVFNHTYFIPNTHYWRGTPSYDIEFSYLTETAVLDAYKMNLLDVMGKDYWSKSQIEADPLLSTQASKYAGTCSFGIMYHNSKAPFNNQKVREAFSHSLNRQEWVNDVLGGMGVPTLTWIPPGYPGHKGAENRFDYDPTAAVQALADSGYTVSGGTLIGPDEIPVVILDTFVNSSYNIIRHTWLRTQWLNTLGVDIVLNPVDSATYTEMTKDIATAPPIFILGWCADNPDPSSWLSTYWKTGGFCERIGYSNPVLDAKLNAADATIDPVLRVQRYMEAQDILVASSPVTFMWHSSNSYLVKPRVIGEVGSPDDFLWMGERDPLSITLGPVWDYGVFLPVILR